MGNATSRAASVGEAGRRWALPPSWPNSWAIAQTEARASLFKLGTDLSLQTAFGAGGEARRGFETTEVFAVASVAVDPENRPVLAINEDDSDNRIVRFDAVPDYLGVLLPGLVPIGIGRWDFRPNGACASAVPAGLRQGLALARITLSRGRFLPSLPLDPMAMPC